MSSDVLAWDSAADWSSVAVAPGAPNDLGGALAALSSADSEEKALDAYWRIDNVVVVQGSVYDGAVRIVGPLVRIVLHRGAVARRWALEAVLQIVGGWPAETSTTVDQARGIVRRSLDPLYALLTDPSADVRELLAEVLSWCETSPPMFAERLDWAIGLEKTESTREVLAQIRSAGLRAGDSSP